MGARESFSSSSFYDWTTFGPKKDFEKSLEKIFVFKYS